MSERTAATFGDQRLPQRFWNKVRIDTGDCWVWTAGVTGYGYGHYRPGGSANQRVAHRVAYETLIAPVPAGLVLDHLCRRPACVNPAHLDAVTQQQNVLRGSAQAARNARVTRCPHGHEYDEANTYVYTRKDGRVGRYCLACRAARRAA